MPRSHIVARELRGAIVVLLVALLITWLFAKLTDDRAEAQARNDLANATTTTTDATTTTIAVTIDDRERLCSLASAFRRDLTDLRIELVNLAGDPITGPDDPPIDVGLHPDGDIPEEVREQRTIAAQEALASGASIPEPDETTSTTVAAEPIATRPPEIINTSRIDPLESGLLGPPQKVALNFYTAASALRLGLIDADFDATAEYFADFVSIGEPARWDLEELAASDFNDRWTALATQPVSGIDATLSYIEETCSVRIGTGFVYRERPPELPILEQKFVPGEVDPGSQEKPAPANDSDG
jgi:hypothetical protein